MGAKGARLYYIDNLRVFLSCLVVLFHLCMSYGGPAYWQYIEHHTPSPALTIFAAVCQSFFMGMFFFVSAYFTPGAFDRKGAAAFLRDRLLRFGIPVLLYVFFLQPLGGYIGDSVEPGRPPFFEYLLHPYPYTGVLWFVAALGLFNFAYAGARWVLPFLRTPGSGAQAKLNDRRLVLFMLVLSAITFAVRLVYPVGRAIPYLGFFAGHFAQYIALFCLGILAAKRRMDNPVSVRQAVGWGAFAAVMALFVLPTLFVAGGVLEGNLDAFLGGMTWQALAFAFWEQCTGMAIIVALIGLAQRKWNGAGPLRKELSACVYAAYVFHPPIIVGVAVLLRGVTLPGLPKFLFVAPFALAATFSWAYLVRKVPYATRIF